MSLASFLLATALAAAPVPDATAQAKKVFGEGQKLYTQGKYQQALARFEEAYALKPLPLLRYNVARCHERLGAPAPALRAYRDFLRLSPKAPEREAVSKAMVELQKQLHDSGVQQLLVLSEPPAAEIEVDGKLLGPAPASIELPGGEHQVTARLPGYAASTRRITITTATMVDLSITLEAALAPPPPPPAVTDAPTAPVLTPAATVVVAPAAEPAPKKRVFTWVAGGVGVAALGAAVGMGVAASGSSQRLRDGTVRPQTETTRPTRCARARTSRTASQAQRSSPPPFSSSSKASEESHAFFFEPDGQGASCVCAARRRVVDGLSGAARRRCVRE